MNRFYISRYLVIILSLASAALHASELSIFLRYDDYSKVSPANTEEKLFEVAEAVEGSVLVGIIPYPEEVYPSEDQSTLPLKLALSEEKRSLIDKFYRRGVITYALHGFSHKNNASSGSVYADGKQSEFSPLALTRQRQLLFFGKEVLRKQLDAPVQIFIPPFNGSDSNTLSALIENGYTLLSAAMGGETSSSISFLPGSGPYPQEIREKALQALSRNEHGIISVTIHPYDFLESKQAFPSFRKGGAPMSIIQFREDLLYLKNQGIDFVSIEDLRRRGEDLSAKRLYANKQLRQSLISQHNLIPEWLLPLSTHYVYYDTSDAKDYYRLQIGVAILMYGSILTICMVVMRRFWEYLANYRHAMITALTGVLTGSLFLGYHAYVSGFHLRTSLISTLLLGTLFSLVSMFALKRKKSRKGAAILTP